MALTYSPNRKIKSSKNIELLCNSLRSQGKKIVAMSGSMDLLHSGHIHALQSARNMGDVLVVLINSDVSIKMYKGPSRPIMNETDRAFMVASLECVDYVVLFDELNPKHLLERVKPKMYCNSPEWGLDCIEREVVEKNGGSIKVIPRGKGISTSDVIKKILHTGNSLERRAIFLDRDGTINKNGNGYIYKKEDFIFVPHFFTSLRKLQKAGFMIFIITNQSGIGRGYYSETHVRKLHSWLKKECKKEGIDIRHMYHCPHTPDAECLCRKPGYEFIIDAARANHLNLSKSWMIGDSWSDTQAGREVNMRTIQIGSTKKMSEQKIRPQYCAKSLAQAVDIVLRAT